MFHVILFIPTLLLSFFVFAQKKIDQKTTDRSDAILKIGMQKNLDALFSQSTNENNQSTTTFVASYFKSIGLKTFIDSSNYIQPFTFDLGKEIKPATSLKINGVTLEPNNDYWPFAFGPNTFFAGTLVWDGLQNNQPYLYDLKLIIEKNKTISKQDLIQHIREKASDLAAKKITAMIVYNSAGVNDNLEFAATDTTNATPIPVIYFTKTGINKLKNESTIATAIDANIILGEKIITGKNAVAFFNNSATNTVIIAAPNNNLISTSAMLQLAKLLKETCQPVKNNSTGLVAENYMNNNYLFISFDDIDSNFFGSHYFLNNLPVSIKNINYAVNINVFSGKADTTNLIIDGTNSSQVWSSVLQNLNAPFNLKLDSEPVYMSNNSNFSNNNIPAIYLCSPSTESLTKRKPTIDANDIKTIHYITQLIGAANNKGKLPFNKPNK